MWPPTNPFEHPLLDDPGQPPSVLTLVQRAVTATSGQGDPTPGEVLFSELNQRGEDAWREAALLLVQHILAWGEFPAGEDGVRRYTSDHPSPDPRLPATNLMHATVEAFLRGQDSGAFGVLVAAPQSHVHGATRFLFVTAAAAGLLNDHQIDALLRTLCKGVL